MLELCRVTCFFLASVSLKYYAITVVAFSVAIIFWLGREESLIPFKLCFIAQVNHFCRSLRTGTILIEKRSFILNFFSYDLHKQMESLITTKDLVGALDLI